MKRALVAAPAAAFLLWASLPLSAALLPTSVDAGDSLSVTCPTRLTHVYANQRREVTLTCAASSAPSATPSVSPSPTSVPTASATATATAVATPTAVATATPSNSPPPSTSCNSYPEPRIFLETQSWWTPIPGITPDTQGHVHLGMCFPVGQTVSGTVTFDVRVLMHDNRGTWIRLKGQDDFSDNFYLEEPDEQAIDGGMVTYWRKVVVDTTEMPDGIRLFRWYADVLHDNGNTQTARAQWALNVQNGTSDRNGPNRLAFLNWYVVDRNGPDHRDWGYIGPQINAVPDVPDAGGSATLNVKCILNGAADSPAIDRTLIHVNPDFHAMPPNTGRTVYDGPPLNGNVTISGLKPGDRIAIRCQQNDGTESHEGVGLVPVK